MLASHRYRFIYTKTNKTAGTSIESFFERYCLPEGEWTLQQNRDEAITEAGIIGFRGSSRPDDCVYHGHMPAAEIRERLGEDIWERYFKFCAVRNPYDKAVSQFYFQKYVRTENRPIRFGDLESEREDFEAWAKEAFLGLDQNRYTIDGEFCLDDVIRYERLESDVLRICERLSIPASIADLESFKGGIRPTAARTEIMYTDQARLMVSVKCAKDLELFGYVFPGEDA